VNKKHRIGVTCGARDSGGGPGGGILAEGGGLRVAESKVLRAAESHETRYLARRGSAAKKTITRALTLCAAWVEAEVRTSNVVGLRNAVDRRRTDLIDGSTL